MYEYNTNLQTYKYKYIWDSQWQSCLMFHMLSLFWLKMTLYNQESQSVLPSNSCQLELPFFCISPWPSPQKCLMTRIQQAPTRSGCAEEGLCAGWGWCTRQPCVLQRPRKKHCQFPTFPFPCAKGIILAALISYTMKKQTATNMGLDK